MLKSLFVLSVHRGAQQPRAVRPAQLRKRPFHQRRRLTQLTSHTLVVDRELLVGLKPFARISNHAFPKFPRSLHVSRAPRHSRQRTPRKAVCFRRQLSFDRLRIVLPRAYRLAAPLANSRHSKQFQRIAAVLLWF